MYATTWYNVLYIYCNTVLYNKGGGGPEADVGAEPSRLDEGVQPDAQLLREGSKVGTRSELVPGEFFKLFSVLFFSPEACRVPGTFYFFDRSKTFMSPSRYQIRYVFFFFFFFSLMILYYVCSSPCIGEYAPTGCGCQTRSSSAEQGKMNLSVSRSRLRNWSRETGSVVQ